MSGREEFVRRGGGFIELAVRLTPKAGRSAIEGTGELADGRTILIAKVRSAPEKGAANKELLELVARSLDVPKSTVSLSAGDKQRLKRIKIVCDPNEVTEKLRRLIG